MRVCRSLVLVQNHPCSSGGVIPSYWQCAQLFTLPKGRSHSYSSRAQTIHFRGVSLITWLYFDPTYICCHVLWRSKIVHLEQRHICFSVSCFGSDESRLVTASRMSCAVSVHNISWEVMPAFPRGSDPAFCQEVTAGNLLPEALEVPHQHTQFAITASFCIFAPKRDFGPFQGNSDSFFHAVR